MRPPLLVIAACLLAACSVGPGSKPPMLVLHYENEQEFEAAATRARDYCQEHFDSSAHTTDRWTGVAGDATFACSP
jgi:hypothetical protein